MAEEDTNVPSVAPLKKGELRALIAPYEMRTIEMMRVQGTLDTLERAELPGRLRILARCHENGVTISAVDWESVMDAFTIENVNMVRGVPEVQA